MEVSCKLNLSSTMASTIKRKFQTHKYRHLKTEEWNIHTLSSYQEKSFVNNHNNGSLLDQLHQNLQEGSQREIIAFTVLLLYGTGSTKPTETCWPCPQIKLSTFHETLQLCIYYWHVWTIHNTITSARNGPTNRQRQTCKDLLKKASSEWKTKTKSLLETLATTLDEYPSIQVDTEFLGVRIPTLLKAEDNESFKTAAKYISLTLLEWTVMDERKENLQTAQNDIGLTNNREEWTGNDEEWNVVTTILLSEAEKAGVDATQWSQLLTLTHDITTTSSSESNNEERPLTQPKSSGRRQKWRRALTKVDSVNGWKRTSSAVNRKRQRAVRTVVT